MRSCVAAFLIGSLVVAGCGGPQQNPEPPASTAKPAPPPMPSIPETRQATAAAKAVGIPPGATSIAIKSTFEVGTDAEFLIGEEKGTLVMAHAITPGGDLDVSVYRADTGARIADESPTNPVFFMARMPETLGYLVAVRNPGKPVPYSLEIEVPRKLVLDDKTGSSEVSGSIPANGVLSYLVPSGTISAELVKAPPDAYLTVHGLAGKQLLKAVDGAKTFTGAAVRSNEEIVVVVNQGAADGDFTLKVTKK